MAILKNGHFGIFVLLHLHEIQPKLLGYQGWVEILMITLVYSKSVRNNLLHSVLQTLFRKKREDICEKWYAAIIC